MENTLIKELDQKGLEIYYQSRVYDTMYWPTFFPLQNIQSLSITTLIGEQGSMVAADVIAFDASAPLKTRQVISKMNVSIPKIAVKRKMTETKILEYQILKKQSNPDASQLLDLVYNDLDFVVTGVNARMEWLALKAISQTKITLDSNNNNGVITESVIDFLMPVDNKLGATVIWGIANAATMKPITDFKDAAEAADEQGVELNYALMDKSTFAMFVNADETKEFVKTYGNITAGGVTPYLDINYINSALSAANLPKIVVIKANIGIEGKDGVIVNSNPWNTSYVTFLPSTGLGNMLNGPIAEELAPPKQVTQAKAGNVLVSKYSTVDPVAELTKGEANAFPAWKNINDCFSLKRDATSWS